MTLQWGPRRPPLPCPGRCLSFIPLLQCPKQPSAHAEDPLPESSAVFPATDRPVKFPFPFPAVSRQLLSSVLGEIRSHYWLLPQGQTDRRTCLQGAVRTSLDDVINLLTFQLVARITLSNAVQSFWCSTCFN